MKFFVVEVLSIDGQRPVKFVKSHLTLIPWTIADKDFSLHLKMGFSNPCFLFIF